MSSHRLKNTLTKLFKQFKTGFGVLFGLRHNLVTGVTTCQVAFVDQFFLVARIVIQGCFCQADAAGNITQCGGPGALKVEQAGSLRKNGLQLDFVLVFARKR